MMNVGEIIDRLMEFPREFELRCLGNTEEFTVEQVGDWNGEFIFLAKHPVNPD